MIRVLSVLLFFALWVVTQAAQKEGASVPTLRRKNQPIEMRVLIDEKKNTECVSWKLSSPQELVLVGNCDGKKRELCTAVVITLSNNKLTINGNEREDDTFIIFSAQRKPIECENQTFSGYFSVIKIGDKLYLVNHIDLEEYVTCVLQAETWPGWPDEVNKAMSVVIRSYGIAKLLEERQMRKKKGITVPYDIKNSIFHQVYKGSAKNNFAQLVAQTKNVVLAFDKKPILAMFHACCGGVVPSRISGHHFDKVPYLERAYPCRYCKPSSLHEWQKKITVQGLTDLFKKEFPKLGKIRDIHVLQKDKAGIVQTVQLRGRTNVQISAKKLKSVLSLKSCCFTVEKKGSRLTIKGRGYGHHVGFCQWGARYMPSSWTYKDMLRFYYPGITFMTLTTKNQSTADTPQEKDAKL